MNTPSPTLLLGKSAIFLQLLDSIARVATINRPVLIIGERGSGKELISARLHFLSPRWGNAFIKLNCGALSDTLLESELFGHEVGSFTGAKQRRLGRFEQSHQGTIFLDEIGNTSSALQEKMLRVVEYGEFERVGGNQTIKIDTRIVAATNIDLPAAVQRGDFRADLLDRLSFEVISIPPLRERGNDILDLANHFAIQMAKELKWEFFPGFSTPAKKSLLNHPWPGNVRELKNVTERSVFRHQDQRQLVTHISLDPFDSPFIQYLEKPKTTLPDQAAAASGYSSEPAHPRDAVFPVKIKEEINAFTKALLKKALASHQYHQRKTAQALNLTYNQLRGMLQKHDLF